MSGGYEGDSAITLSGNDVVEQSFLRQIVATRSTRKVLELQAELDAYRADRAHGFTEAGGDVA